MTIHDFSTWWHEWSLASIFLLRVFFFYSFTFRFFSLSPFLPYLMVVLEKQDQPVCHVQVEG